MMLRLETSSDGKDWGLRLALNLAEATGADVVMFLRDVADLIAKDEQALERIANAEGRTTQHPLFEAVGTITIGRK